MILSKAILAGGCFWKLQSAFENINGVVSVQGGYTGGRVPNPTYMEISGGRTGHAEALEIIYDSQAISFPKLLDIFFEAHDPTQLNRQGSDIGPLYRSIIFYTSEQQKQEALKKITELQKTQKYSKPIVTEIKPIGVFYPASVHITSAMSAVEKGCPLYS